MNKEKTLKIVDDLINHIKENEENPEYECAKIYIDSWVIGALTMIKNKITDKCIYPANATYSQLFQDFVSKYFCKNINPSIKVYAIACLFDFKARSLIINLYNHLFTLDQRVTNAQSVGYVYEYSQDNEQTMFEIIRLCYTRQGGC